MNLPASYPAPSSAHLGIAPGEPLRIANAANSNTFGVDYAQFEPRWDGVPGAPPESGACQNGTVEYAPLWNGPALRPAFAAQVLGQAISAGKSRGSRLAAQSYRRAVSRIPAALLLDVSI